MTAAFAARVRELVRPRPAAAAHDATVAGVHGALAHRAAARQEQIRNTLEHSVDGGASARVRKAELRHPWAS